MTQQTIDTWGTAASLGCAIHCACMPLLLALLPLLGGSFLASEPLEWILFLLAAVLGSLSASLGFRKHGQKKAVYVMLVGLVILLAGRLLHTTTYHGFGVVALVVGGITVATAHMMNHHLCRCKHKHEESYVLSMTAGTEGSSLQQSL